MDGVLIDARDWHYRAFNRALGLFGMEISYYDHLVTYDGLPTYKKLEMLSAERGLSEKLHPFINEMKQKYTMELVYSHCKPQFHHEYALSRLKKEGYQLAVASNSIRDSVKVMMERSGLINYLDLYLSSQDVKMGKPDPEIYLLTIQRLGINGNECLIVEDNENGKRAARESGAWLMEVNDVKEVNYQNIIRTIQQLDTINHD